MKQKLNLLKEKTTTLLKQGLTPKQLIQSIIVSGFISTIPIPGVCTLLITAISLKRKLNFPVMISISYLLWPVQLLLIFPFIRLGEFIFSVPRHHHTAEEIINSFQNSFLQTLSQLSFELLCGFAGWFVLAVPISIGVYWVSLLFLKMKKLST